MRDATFRVFDDMRDIRLSPVHNTTQGTYFNTIQVAINAADANDAITAAAGTYLENITVNKTLP